MASGSANPILVTGMPRSGTTWVGRMLHESGQTTYVAEPLNIWRRPRPLRSRTAGWPGYPYVTRENEDAYLPVVTEIVHLKMRLLSELRVARDHEDLIGVVSTWLTFMGGRIHGRRPLLKEPHAFFLAPWFAERLGGKVVITVRHPAAVVSSWKRLDWPVDLGQLLQQDLLVRDWLAPYEADIVALHSSDDTVAQVALLWKLVYGYVDPACSGSSALTIVRHEDLSMDPVKVFRSLYEAVELSFTSLVESAVRGASSSGNPKELEVEQPYAVRLDSAANLTNWKKRLTKEEVRRVRDITEGVASIYYDDESWAR